MNQQWNGGNSFMEGIDAGNRLFESIAEVEQRKIATQAATQELPLRLMQLQTANEQVRQQMDIRAKAAPLEYENLKLSGLESELQIQQHRYANSVRESEILDQDKISDAQARWARGDMAQPDLSTVRGNQIWQEWSSQNAMKKALDSDLTSFRTSASALKGDQRAEIMAIQPLPSGAPSPAMWKKLGEFQKKNEQEAAEEKRNTYKFQQDEVEDRMLKVQKSKNDAALARAKSGMNDEFGSHKDPMIRSAFIAGSRAINDDPSADSETKLARLEKLRSDLSDPNYGKTKLSYGAQSQLRAIDAKVEGLAKQQADLYVTDPTGKNKKVQQQIRDIDSQIGILEGKKGELSGSVKAVSSGTGRQVYDPVTRGLVDAPTGADEATEPDQGPMPEEPFTGYRPIPNPKASTGPKAFPETKKAAPAQDGISRAVDAKNRVMDAAREVVPAIEGAKKKESPKAVEKPAATNKSAGIMDLIKRSNENSTYKPTGRMDPKMGPKLGESFADFIKRVEKEAKGESKETKKDLILEGVQKMLDQRYK